MTHLWILPFNMSVHKKNMFSVTVAICFFAVFAFVYAPEAFAQGNYNLIEPLGDTTQITRGDTVFADYATTVYNLAIALAAVLAVFMIVLGGVQYTTAYGNPSRVQAAKDRIKNAVFGLLLILAAYLLLWSINPDLVDLSITIQPLY